jgi:hypothetical protein
LNKIGRKNEKERERDTFERLLVRFSEIVFSVRSETELLSCHTFLLGLASFGRSELLDLLGSVDPTQTETTTTISRHSER